MLRRQTYLQGRDYCYKLHAVWYFGICNNQSYQTLQSTKARVENNHQPNHSACHIRYLPYINSVCSRNKERRQQFYHRLHVWRRAQLDIPGHHKERGSILLP